MVSLPSFHCQHRAIMRDVARDVVGDVVRDCSRDIPSDAGAMLPAMLCTILCFLPEPLVPILVYALVKQNYCVHPTPPPSRLLVSTSHIIRFRSSPKTQTRYQPCADSSRNQRDKRELAGRVNASGRISCVEHGKMTSQTSPFFMILPKKTRTSID